VAVAKKLVLGYSPWAYPGPQPFGQLFQGGTKDCVKEGFDGVDCFLLSGGTDINPEYYKEDKHKHTQASDYRRDKWEWKAMHYCRANSIPMIGICRGAQFLCVAAGGSLIQHVTHHHGTHGLITEDGAVFETNSVHHQMMNPWKIPHKLLAWAQFRRSNFYENGEGKDVREMFEHQEPEVIYFPDWKAIGIQGHPEYSNASLDFKNFCIDSVNDYLLKA
jgi:gamma-glutamyl-gamma-aminobutyrate hydrolase PuuD